LALFLPLTSVLSPPYVFSEVFDLKPMSWSCSLWLRSGERTRPRVRRWRLADDFLWLDKRSISARRRNGHARARALPGKEEPPGDHAGTKSSKKLGTFVHLLTTIKRLASLVAR